MLAFRAAAILLGIVVALAACEIVLRVLQIRPERYAAPRWRLWNGAQFVEIPGLPKVPSRFESLGILMGEYAPHARFQVVYATNPRGYFEPDGAVTMEVNSHGLRGPEVAIEPAPGTFRILGLGDSFTFGVGVRDQDTFLRRLETSLNAAVGARRSEVLNAGVQGYNTRDELICLERRWLAFKPRLVLIVFYLNDAYSDAAFLNMGQAQGIYLRPSALARASRAVDLAEHAWKNRRVTRQVQDYYRQHYFAAADRFLDRPGEMQVDWTVSRAALAQAAALARAQNFALAMVIFPEFHGLAGRYPFESIHKLVRDSAAALGIPVLDLLNTYRGRHDVDLWVHPTDHHPNEIANALAAEALERFLREKRLIP